MEFNPAFSKIELCSFLMQKGVAEDDAKKLQGENVDGEIFPDINEADLKEIGVKLGSRKKIMKIIYNLKQPLLENVELQDLQTIGSDSNLSNAVVYDLVPADSSCTVLPKISSTTSLACSTTNLLPVPSTTTKNVSALNKTRSKIFAKKKSTLPSTYLSAISSESISSSSVTDLCTEDPSIYALSTYAVPERINVLAMLDEHSTGKAIMNNLKSGQDICKTDVNEIVRIVVRGMIDDLRTLYPTTTQKVNLAKAIVRDIPELKTAYEQFYNPKNNSGCIEWRLKTLRVGVASSVKKKRPRKCRNQPEMNEEEKQEIVIDDETQKKVNWLKSQPAVEMNKAQILNAMEETFNIRRNFIVERTSSVADILEEFPLLKEFDGALIDADFKLMYPNARNLLDVLPEYSEKIRIYVTQKRKDISERVGHVADANFKAMMYLADLLPIREMRKRKLEDDRIYHPSELLVTFAGEDSTVSLENLTNHPQLLCCGEIQEEQLQFFLILDKEFVDLGKCFIKAFDILYKSHKVFNIDYPKNLAIFYNFLDTMIYKINTGAVDSSVEHLHNTICSVNATNT